MTNVKLISVAPSDANLWCRIHGCISETEFLVRIQIGNLTTSIPLCSDCKDELLREVTT